MTATTAGGPLVPGHPDYLRRLYHPGRDRWRERRYASGPPAPVNRTVLDVSDWHAGSLAEFVDWLETTADSVPWIVKGEGYTITNGPRSGTITACVEGLAFLHSPEVLTVRLERCWRMISFGRWRIQPYERIRFDLDYRLAGTCACGGEASQTTRPQNFGRILGPRWYRNARTDGIVRLNDHHPDETFAGVARLMRAHIPGAAWPHPEVPTPDTAWITTAIMRGWGAPLELPEIPDVLERTGAGQRPGQSATSVDDGDPWCSWLGRPEPRRAEAGGGSVKREPQAAGAAGGGGEDRPLGNHGG